MPEDVNYNIKLMHVLHTLSGYFSVISAPQEADFGHETYRRCSPCPAWNARRPVPRLAFGSYTFSLSGARDATPATTERHAVSLTQVSYPSLQTDTFLPPSPRLGNNNNWRLPGTPLLGLLIASRHSFLGGESVNPFTKICQSIFSTF